jgi:hypothetical protein
MPTLTTLRLLSSFQKDIPASLKRGYGMGKQDEVIIRKNIFLGNTIDFMKSTGCGWEKIGQTLPFLPTSL